MFEKQINMINEDFQLSAEIEGSIESKEEVEKRELKYLMLTLLSDFKLNTSKNELYVYEVDDFIRAIFKKPDLNLLIKTFNYLSSARVGVLKLNFIYYLEDNTMYPITSEQYQAVANDEDVLLTDSDLEKIKEFDRSRVGFYSTIIREGAVE